MARIRTIKPEFWTHEDLSELPEATHMLAAALLNHADDEGYFNAHPGLVRAACCPLREPSVSVQVSLKSLAEIGFIELGQSEDGKRYGRVVKFDDHQRVNRPTPSKIKALAIVWESSSTAHTQLSESSPPERNREQGKEQGREGNREQDSSLRSESGSQSEPLLTSPDTSNIHQHPVERLITTVLATYHEILPKCRRMEALTPKRKKRIQAADKLARQVCRDQGWDYDTEAFWRAYFAECAKDPWMRGDVPNPRNAKWKQNLEVLTDEDRFGQVMDGAIAGMREAA